MYFARKNPTSEMQAEQTSQSKEYPPLEKLTRTPSVVIL